MARSPSVRILLPIFFSAYAVIILSDYQLRKMERFEELVAKGQGINSPLADFIHRKYGATLAIKQVREDLEFEIEPKRRLQLWFELKEAHRTLNDPNGVVEACDAWITEYPNDPKTLGAYEEMLINLNKQNKPEKVKVFLQKWADSLIAMGPETKLGDILKWWEFAHIHPNIVDEQPLLEKVFHDFPKHVPALGALQSLKAVYDQQGKAKESAAVGEQIKLLLDRASPLQQNQSTQLVIQFLLNHRMWPQVQERLIFAFENFPKSENFNNHLNKILAQSRQVLGPQQQLEFYRQTTEQALKKVSTPKQANNLPMGRWLGDYGLLLWEQKNFAEMERIAKILQTVDPGSMTAYQLERLLWLQNPAVSTRVPHVMITRVSPPPMVDGAPTDRCWFGDEHQLGELKAIGSIPQLATKAWATYDADNLYLLIQCQEPEATRVFQKDTAGAGSLTDSVEVFFNVKKDYSTYYQVGASINGAVTTYGFAFLDEVVDNTIPEPKVWPANVAASILPSSNAWTCEMKIPWASLGVRPQEGLSFFFNVRRIRHARGTAEFYSWAPMQGTDHSIETFGIIVLK